MLGIVWTFVYLICSAPLVTFWAINLNNFHAAQLYEPARIAVVAAYPALVNATVCCDPSCTESCRAYSYSVVQTYAWEVDTYRAAYAGPAVYNGSVVMDTFVDNTGTAFDGYYSICPFDPVGHTDIDRCGSMETETVLQQPISLTVFWSTLISWCVLTLIWLFLVCCFRCF
jgi:hypothetical protein